MTKVVCGAKPLPSSRLEPLMHTPDILTLDYNGSGLRVAIKHGSPWFSANDLWTILRPGAAAAGPCPNTVANWMSPADHTMHPLQTRTGVRMARVVTERGLYAMCDKAEVSVARPFRDWIVDEALPTIRRTYAAGRTAPALAPEDLALMREASVLIERLGARLGGGAHSIA